ncbi:orotate phosphoribosyltransferase [Bacillus sp. FSL W7-1360]
MSEQIAQHLLDIGAVSLSPSAPFTWSSGLKSPIYCDNRLTLSYPHVRTEIAHGLANLVRTHAPDADVIAGTATAGIPHAALVSDLLGLPMIYVRGSAKGHGKKNLIEGELHENENVVVIEDLISTGGSALAAVEAIRSAGGNPLLVAAIFSYELPKAAEAFQVTNVPFQVLTNYPTLVQVAKSRGMITTSEQEKLATWRKNPADESWLT